MPAYNFKGRFEHAVASGRKRQTIRQRRKDGRDARPGQKAFCFVGMRTKQCRRIAEGEILSVDRIEIRTLPRAGLRVLVCDRILSTLEIESLAKADGFSSRLEFQEFFVRQYGLPFKGLVIQWKLSGGGNS